MSDTATTQDTINNDQLLELLNDWFFGEVEDVPDGYSTVDEETGIRWTFYLEADGVEVNALTSTTKIATAAELDDFFYAHLN